MKTTTTTILAAAAVAMGAPALAGQQSHNPVLKNPHVMPTPTPAHGSNSFTESQARGRLMKAGYTGIGRLAKDRNGAWMGTAHKGGHAVHVGLDYKGNVTAR